MSNRLCGRRTSLASVAMSAAYGSSLASTVSTGVAPLAGELSRPSSASSQAAKSLRCPCLQPKKFRGDRFRPNRSFAASNAAWSLGLLFESTSNNGSNRTDLAKFWSSGTSGGTTLARSNFSPLASHSAFHVSHFVRPRQFSNCQATVIRAKTEKNAMNRRFKIRALNSHRKNRAKVGMAKSYQPSATPDITKTHAA